MRNNGKNSWLHIQSIAVSALVILFFVGIILAYYFMLLSETRERITKIGELNAVRSAKEIEQYLSEGIVTMNLACYTLDGLIRSGKSQEEIYEFMVNQTNAMMNSSFETTGFYGLIKGEYLDGAEWIPDADFIPTERPWYIDARANVGRVAVVDPYVDLQTYETMITFSKTLCDAKSVAAMDFSMNRLQKITEAQPGEESSGIRIILDRKYQVIAHSDKSEIGKSYLQADDSLGSALVNKLRSSDESFFSLKHNGSEYIVYRVSVANDWLCLSVFDATAEFGQLFHKLLFTIVVVMLAVFVLLLIMNQLNKKREQIAQLSIQAVEAIATVIDAKDSYTKGHSDRVANYAREISKRAGNSQKQQDEIYMMGPLHDVGKIGIPDAVINKPGKLTKEEFDIIKTHPDIGWRILSKNEELNRLAMGARWHHERYDGKGYPDGLSGTDIPEEARIIAVADAYDAMTSRRSYRDGLPQDVVRQEIIKGKGTQFDPQFADIMLQMIGEDPDYQMRDRQPAASQN